MSLNEKKLKKRINEYYLREHERFDQKKEKKLERNILGYKKNSFFLNE